MGGFTPFGDRDRRFLKRGGGGGPLFWLDFYDCNVIGSGLSVFLFILTTWGVNGIIRTGRPPSMPYWLVPSGVRKRVSPRKIAVSFFKLGTPSSGLRLSICVQTEKKVLGMIRRSCVFCLGHLKVKRSSYKILDLPTSPSHVWGRSAGFRSMPKDFCWFENVIGRCLIVFLFIYKDLGGSASSSRGQHHPECLSGLTQVRLRSGGALGK